MLKQRILTALVLIPLVIALIFYAPLFYLALFVGLVTLAAAAEWCDLFGFSYLEKLSYVALVAMFMFLMTKVALFPLIILSVVFWLVSIVMVITFPGDTPIQTSKLAPAWMGITLLLPFWASIILLAESKPRLILFSLLLLVWAADTGAYFAGKFFGKHKLIPKVSPNKTWEGVVGGFISTLLVAGILFLLKPDVFQVAQKSLLSIESAPIAWLVIAGLIYIISVFGDLFESMIKRIQNVKDSGRCLPGHGGILDRIDSLLAAGPVLLFLLGI